MNTNQYLSQAIKEINKQGDKLISLAIVLYFFTGLFLATFYDTWLVAVGVGLSCTIAYFITKYLLPDKNWHHYVASSVFSIFMAQFIYQMHGMFEMHFWAFVAAALMIIYQNWKLYIPLSLIILGHHASFAYLQFSGMSEIYFTQSQYMDLTTFLFHGTLAVLIIGICGAWSYKFFQQTKESAVIREELSSQLDLVNENISFAESISSGEYNLSREIAEHDALGNALGKMQFGLKEARERETEEKFINQGLAFVNEILRKYQANEDELCNNLLSNLVKYLKINQGAIFLLDENQETPHLKLAACYAYDRKKYIDKQIAIGQGLVGQCYLERDAIYMTDIPQGYTYITSGLGDATASSLLLVPLMYNEKVVGVIELASLHTMDEITRNFVTKIAENIAASLISTQSNVQTKVLLEKAQEQADLMAAQEEEMRQNMEEIQATQEQMNLHERRSKAIFEKMNGAVLTCDLQNMIEQVNPAAEKLIGYRNEELVGKPLQVVFDEPLNRNLVENQLSMFNLSQTKSPIVMHVEASSTGDMYVITLEQSAKAPAEKTQKQSESVAILK